MRDKKATMVVTRMFYNWIRSSDMVPEYGHMVMVKVRNDKTFRIAHLLEFEGWYSHGDGEIISTEDVTHWVELPDQPIDD